MPLARIPIRSLDYINADQAVAKELVVNYESGEIYTTDSEGNIIPKKYLGIILTDTGSVNNIVLTSDPAVSAYVNGVSVWFKLANTNTESAVTINVDGLGANSFIKNNGDLFRIGDLVSGAIYGAVFDSSNNSFRLIGSIDNEDAVTAVFTASGALSSIPVPDEIKAITLYGDSLEVYQNGLLLASSINYTLNLDTDTITLNGYTCDSGDVFTFVTGGSAGGSKHIARSIKDYGAVGDGLIDDTVAIQAALDDLPADGGCLFVPSGTYMVSGLRMTRKAGALIYGEGYGSTIKLINDSNEDLLYCTWADRSIFSRFRLDGNRANNTSGNCIVLTDNSSYACIQEMEIQYAAEYGIKTIGGFDPENPTNYLYTDEVHVNQSFVRWNGKSGLNLDGVGGLIITNAEFEYNEEHGICSTLTGISGANGHIITGNNILSNKGSGIHLFTSSRVTISDNVFCFNSKEGIYIEGGGRNTISNNQFEDNGQVDLSPNIKICYLTSGEAETWIMHNIITNVETVSPKAYNGVQGYNAGTIYLLGNHISNHPGGSIFVQNTEYLALFNTNLSDNIQASANKIHEATVTDNEITSTILNYEAGKIYYLHLSAAVTAACTLSINSGTAYDVVDKTGSSVTALASGSVIQIYQASSSSNYQVI